MLESFVLTGNCRSQLNTELRFLFAGARFDGTELVRLDLPTVEDERESARMNSCVIKVLRTLKKENVIEFYATKDSFAANSTEASFLLNKYGELIADGTESPSYIFVKI